MTHQTKADSLIKKFLHQENEQEKRIKLNYSRITCSVIGEYQYAAPHQFKVSQQRYKI
jgi:hypothetical protein